MGGYDGNFIFFLKKYISAVRELSYKIADE